MLASNVAACADDRVPSAHAKHAPPVATADESSVSYDISGELKAVLDEIESIRQGAGVASVGIALVSEDQVLFAGGLGVASWETRRPASEDTVFRLGSITKSFTGLTALHRLRQREELFSQPVNKVIPDLLSQRGADQVTLPQLLEHTAGLSDLSRKEFAFQGENVTYTEAIAIDPATRRLSWPAGLHSSYSNAGYGYAGYLLETDAGEPYEQLVHKHVLKPLGMRNTGFYVKPETSLAAGYDTDGKTPIPYWHMIYRSFGGLNATPSDMGLFVKALLQPAGEGEVFGSPFERQRFENPATTLAARAGLDYGYGLGNYHWFNNGMRFHGHGGDADGYLSHYGYSVEAGYGYFVVITAFNKKPLSAIRSVLETYIAELSAQGEVNEVAPFQVSTLRLKRSRLEQLAGDYVAVTRRFGSVNASEKPELEIRIENGQLQTRRGGRQLPLTAVSYQKFRRPWQPEATYAFITTDEGDVYLQGDMGNFRKKRLKD